MSTTRRRADGGVPALWLVTRTDSNKTTSYLVYNAWITTNKEIHIELPAQPSMAFACLLVCLLACLLACVLQRCRAPILMRFHRPQHPGIAHASVASLLEHREGLQPSIVPALFRHSPRVAGSNLASRHGGRQREETQ